MATKQHFFFLILKKVFNFFKNKSLNNEDISSVLVLQITKSVLKQQIIFFEEYIKFSKKMLHEYEQKIQDDYQKNSQKDVVEEKDMISDDFYNKEIYKKTSFEMVIIANYRLCELTLKKLLCTKLKENEIMGLNFHGLKKKFKPMLNLGLIENYTDVNELRLLNNCIKHNGKVSRKLSNITRNKPRHWIQDDEISIDENIIDRMYKASEKFLLDVIEQFSFE